MLCLSHVEHKQWLLFTFAIRSATRSGNCHAKSERRKNMRDKMGDKMVIEIMEYKRVSRGRERQRGNWGWFVTSCLVNVVYLNIKRRSRAPVIFYLIMVPGVMKQRDVIGLCVASPRWPCWLSGDPSPAEWLALFSGCLVDHYWCHRQHRTCKFHIDLDKNPQIYGRGANSAGINTPATLHEYATWAPEEGPLRRGVVTCDGNDCGVGVAHITPYPCWVQNPADIWFIS